MAGIVGLWVANYLATQPCVVKVLLLLVGKHTFEPVYWRVVWTYNAQKHNWCNIVEKLAKLHDVAPLCRFIDN